MGTRRIVGAVVGCVLAAFVATGWAGPATASSSSPAGAKEWAADVCAATRTWTHVVERAATRAQRSFAEDALTEGPLPSLLAYLGAAADATETLTAEVDDAGVPDVRGGRDAARVLVQTLDGIETGFRDARRDLAPLTSSTDPAEIAAGSRGRPGPRLTRPSPPGWGRSTTPWGRGRSPGWPPGSGPAGRSSG